MNEKQLEKKIKQDTADIRRDLNALMENGVSNVTKGFEKIQSETKDTLSDAAKSVKKDLGYGIRQYNAKTQEYVDKLPGDFVDKVTKYPWVAITVGLGVGLLLGGSLKPSFRS